MSVITILYRVTVTGTSKRPREESYAICRLNSRGRPGPLAKKELLQCSRLLNGRLYIVLPVTVGLAKKVDDIVYETIDGLDIVGAIRVINANDLANKSRM